MTEPDLVRRLTTIMDIDVVGFSTMSARDEEHALGLLGARMATAQALVKHHRGRVFKLTGDGLLAEFASPVEAVRAALEIQEAMRAANDQAGPDDQLVLRIGVNLGDVVESGDDLMGDAVNVAARLESIAKPGGICVSAAVYEQIEGKLTLGAEDLGEQHVKNIPRAIHAYRLTLGGAPVVAAPPADGRKAHAPGRHHRQRRGSGRPGDRRRLAAARAVGAGAGLDAHGAGARACSRRIGDATAQPAARTAAPPARHVDRGPAASRRSAARHRRLGPTLPSEVPFVPQWRERRLEDYAVAEDAKAMAINVRGWFAVATRMLDETIGPTPRPRGVQCAGRARGADRARFRPLRDLRRRQQGGVAVPGRRPCRRAPYVPAARLSPPVPFDAATVPLVTERARQNLAEHYMKTTRQRALVLGHGHLEWWSPSESDADAIRRNLQTCGQITGRACVVYSVDDQVVVRVPQLHRVTGIFTPRGCRRRPMPAGGPPSSAT